MQLFLSRVDRPNGHYPTEAIIVVMTDTAYCSRFFRFDPDDSKAQERTLIGGSAQFFKPTSRLQWVCENVACHSWYSCFIEHPDAMVGIPTGEASGVWVCDLDKKAGADGRENARSLWEAETGDSGAFDAFLFDGTLVISAPSGGCHVYFKWAGGRNIRNSAGQIAIGIDVRGAGGYVIAPGSVNAAGKRYELESFDLEICAAPEWLSERAENPKSKKPKPSKENDIDSFDLMEVVGHGYTLRSQEALAQKIDWLSNAIEGTQND